jgi:hypothetical protein
MLAPLLGLNLGLRQSLVAVLLSFTVFSAVLGAFSPIIGFVIWNAPPLVADDWRQTSLVYSGIMLLHVVAIAFGGIAGNLRMLQMLEYFSGQRAVARRVLFAWLAGNLFVGSQLSWILRPFIGSPVLPVEFLRPNAFHGNFYETVFQSFLRVIHP